MNICSFNYWFCHLVYSLLKHFSRPTISLIEIYHILLLKKLRKLHKWRTKEVMGLKKKQCIWKSCPRNRNKNPAKTWCSDTSGPPVVAATVHWSLLRSGSVTEVCQITQEMDWKSVAGSLKEWWMPIWEFWFKWSSICTIAICKTQYSWRQLKDITRKLANDSGCVKE